MAPRNNPDSDVTRREVSIRIEDALFHGELVEPRNALGLVLFAHGSGSSRHSPRNRYVAQVLQSRSIATLLFDLLTAEEEQIDNQTAELRFDIPFLASRLIAATEWALHNSEIRRPRIGYFGASTGAGAALIAAASLGDSIAAIVSRGGRPDLAGESLAAVRAPTLLIVGGEDTPVIAMNRAALQQLSSHDKRLVIVPGATHLFEEPGTLEEVARLAADWFTKHLHAAKPS